jgi:hypothetical protein
MIVVYSYALMLKMFYHIDMLLFGFFMDSFNNVDDFATCRWKVVDFIIEEFFSALIAMHDWRHFEQLLDCQNNDNYFKLKLLLIRSKVLIFFFVE